MRSYHRGWTIVILCSPVSSNLFWENCSLYRMLLQDCYAEIRLFTIRLRLIYRNF
ncbi:hypothetical protein LDENG_00155170 [Lucifuga dentata]|nr:hypothetical protein LDENG_00155170 [Lucifuga dentata]